MPDESQQNELLNQGQGFGECPEPSDCGNDCLYIELKFVSYVDCYDVIHSHDDKQQCHDAVEPSLKSGYSSHHLAERLHTVGKNPCHKKDGKCRCDGENERKEITCGGFGGHRDEHTEVEQSAGGTECQGKEDAEDETVPCAFHHTIDVTVEAELGQVELITKEHEEADKDK